PSPPSRPGHRAGRSGPRCGQSWDRPAPATRPATGWRECRKWQAWTHSSPAAGARLCHNRAAFGEHSGTQPMHIDPALPRQTRAFIVLTALLQGGLMYLAQQGSERGWWPLAGLGGRVCWYTLVLTVPTALVLVVQRLGDRRLWRYAGALATVFLALAAWAGWNATGAPGLRSGQVLGPFGTALALGLFVALPWLQCRLAHASWRAPYPELFEHAWQNALTLALAAMFTGICWAVLHLWGQLFVLVDVHVFRDLFGEDPFIYLATGTMAGLGILIGRTQ